jgi:hypothetical protein
VVELGLEPGIHILKPLIDSNAPASSMAPGEQISLLFQATLGKRNIS